MPEAEYDDADDDDDDADVVEEDAVQLKKMFFLLFLSRGGGVLFLSPTPTGGNPLRLTFCQYLHKQLVRKMTPFGPLSRCLSFTTL